MQEARSTEEGIVTVALDPGLTSGLAVYHWPKGHFASEQVEGRFDLYKRLNTMMASGFQMEFVLERFTINSQTFAKSPQYDALYIIGHVEAVCYASGIPFALQTPTQAKAFSTDDKLKKLGWYKPTPGGHANDAARHLLRWLVTARLDRGGKRFLEALV